MAGGAGDAAAAVCVYCVVLTILWSASYKYRVYELPGHTVTVFERVSFWFAAGRLAGCVLMRRVDPAHLLQWSTGLCLIAVAATAVAGGMAGWVGIIAASAFLPIVYPTVFGMALGRHRNRVAHQQPRRHFLCFAVCRGPAGLCAGDTSRQAGSRLIQVNAVAT